MNMNKEVMLLDVKDVLPNRFQPRIVFDEKEITELSESIKEHGVIQPIVVRKIADKYEIIAGERRYKASLMAGKTTIPAIITDLNDKDSAEIALIENIQRSNLSPIEEAISYKKILDMGYLNQSDLALKLGKTQSTVANKLRLLNLSEDVQEELLKGKISERHARSLLRLSKKDQEKMVKRIIKERMTVRKTDEEIEKILHPEKEEEKKKIIKYILEEDNQEGGTDNMNNQETIGSFNIPTTPILEKDNEATTNNVNSTLNVESGTANNNINVENTQRQPESSPITFVEPISPIGITTPETTNQPIENSVEPKIEKVEPEKPINPFFNPNVSPITPPTMNTVNTSVIDNAILGQENVELTQNSINPVNPSNSLAQLTLQEQANVNNMNNISNVDPTNPEPVTGGKFFNMFSETTQDEDAGTSTQSITNPFAQKIEEAPINNEVITPEVSALNTPTIESNIPVTPTPIPSLESVNNTQNNVDSITPNEIVNPVTEPQMEQAPIANPINPFIQMKMEETPAVPEAPVEVPAPTPVTPDPVSIDTVPQTPVMDQPVISPTEMTPLQTYRLNDDQTFENTSVVELGSFGGGRMEEAVLQPLRVEETRKPKAALKEVINTIRDCAKTIENMGYNIDTDEIDFEDNYQVTFKIMKEDI